MSRPDYFPRQDYEGAGNLAVYTFDFKIEDLLQLKIIVLNNTGIEVQNLRGDDTTYLSSVVFDSTLGGGTVTLLANLPVDYHLTLLEANDAPTQPFEFKDKASFTLTRFENALDFLGGAIQRLAYLVSGAVRLNDATDPTDFDTTLPISLTPGTLLAINAAGDGFELVSAAEILGLSEQSAFAIVQGQVATDLLDMLVDSASFTSRVFEYEIVRGSNVFSTGRFALHYRNAVWYLVMSGDDRDDSSSAHGVTFSLTGTTVAQVRAAVASDGEGDGSIKLKFYSFSV